MNIVLLGHRDIASNVALSLLMTALPQHRYRILLSGELPAKGRPDPALGRLLQFEQALCTRLPGRYAEERVLSFEALGERTGAAVGLLPRPNSPEGVALLEAAEPDLVVSVRYRRILGDPAIRVPRLGVLNLHSGLLPEYKGVMATFWAMLNGEPEIGSTLHYIVDGGIDTGPIVGQAALPVERDRSYLANLLSLYGPGCRLIIETLNRIERGGLVEGERQAPAGTYYSVPGRDAVRSFDDAGLRLFEAGDLDDFLQRL